MKEKKINSCCKKTLKEHKDRINLNVLKFLSVIMFILSLIFLVIPIYNKHLDLDKILLMFSWVLQFWGFTLLIEIIEKRYNNKK